MTAYLDAMFEKLLYFLIDVLKLIPVAALCYGLYRLLRLLRAAAVSKLSYKRYFSEDHAFVGATLDMVEEIYNPTPFPLFFIDIEEYIYYGLGIDDLTESGKGLRLFVSRINFLLPFMQIKRTHKISCLRRGVYTLDTVSILANGNMIPFDSPASLTVYPEPAKVPDALPPASLSLGETVTSRALISDPFSVSGIRDYRFGDTMHGINYKATARFSYSPNPIKVNNYDFSQNNNFLVCLNFHTPWKSGIDNEDYEELMEKGLSICAGIVNLAIRSGGRTGFAANCKHDGKEKFLVYKMNSGMQHYLDILGGMAKIQPIDGMSFAAMIDHCIALNTQNTQFIIITTYMDSLISQKLSALTRFNNTVKIIMIGERHDEEI